MRGHSTATVVAEQGGREGGTEQGGRGGGTMNKGRNMNREGRGTITHKVCHGDDVLGAVDISTGSGSGSEITTIDSCCSSTACSVVKGSVV